MVRHDEHVAAVADEIENAVDRLVGLLIGELHIGRIASDLCRVLVCADAVRIGEAGRLPAVGERELVA